MEFSRRTRQWRTPTLSSSHLYQREIYEPTHVWVHIRVVSLSLQICTHAAAYDEWRGEGDWTKEEMHRYGASGLIFKPFSSSSLGRVRL